MKTCGKLVVELLEAYGVDTVFGIPGVHTIELYRGLSKTGIRHITPRHEQGAGFMADGYARATGKAGVCFIITGPGMTNIATAMGQAYGDSVPMLVISSVHRLAQIGMGEGRLHELTSQRDLVAGVAAFSHTLLCPDELPDVLARAFALFARQRPRPVHIQIPIDVMAASADHVSYNHVELPPPSRPDSDAIETAIPLLRDAKHPVVVIGGGTVDAAPEALKLIEFLDSPTVNTINAKGVMPPNHPLSAGENLGFKAHRELVTTADVVLAVGTEFGETDMFPDQSPLEIDGRLIRIDIDVDQLVRNVRADLGITSDATQALRALNAGLGVSARGPKAGDSIGARVVAGVRAASREEWSQDFEIHKRLLDKVQETLNEPIIVGDSTWPIYNANCFYQPERVRSYFTSATGYGTLGYALPAAVGAKLGAPERSVVCVIGDGGVQFTVAELASAVEAKASIIVLLWNNECYGAVKDAMIEFDVQPIGVDIYTPDFLSIARGFGCFAKRAISYDHLAELLREAGQAEVPSVIEVRGDAAFLHNA